MAATTEPAEGGRPPRTLLGELEKRSVFTDLSVFDTDYIPDRGSVKPVSLRTEFRQGFGMMIPPL